MLCKVYRWKISGSIDSGQPVSAGVKRHLLRCASCRRFAAEVEDLGRRLNRDSEALVGFTDPVLAERISASLAPPDRARIVGEPGSRRRIRFRLSPALAAAAALLAAGAAVLWLARSRPAPTPGPAPAVKIEQPGKYLVAAVERVNSPYEKEMRLWRETLDGVAGRLRAAFDIGLGE